MSTVANFKLPLLHLAPQVGLPRSNFVEIFGKKLEFMAYHVASGDVCVILSLGILCGFDTIAVCGSLADTCAHTHRETNTH